MVTLRIRLGGGLAGGGGVPADRDAVPDGDLLRPDEDVLDEQMVVDLRRMLGKAGYEPS